MKLRIRRKVNECEGMNTPTNTVGIGNPVIGDLNGNVGSGDLWQPINKNKKKIYKIKKKVAK